MPPQNLDLHGLRAQYGLGPQGVRGSNQGNVWGR
jgi:hypothetical protein